ncbi:MAG: oligosaccharide flippase family protein [Bacteroides cellulosilyticus]
MWIISKIRNDNSSKMLLANFTYLSIIEIIGLLLPLITFPYLIRTIGAQKYGIIVFAQTIVAYLVMIVNFGFNVSATRRISENRHNINKINEIYSSVIFQKLLIFIIALVVTIIILYLFDYKYSFYYNWFNWFYASKRFYSQYGCIKEWKR